MILSFSSVSMTEASRSYASPAIDRSQPRPMVRFFRPGASLVRLMGLPLVSLIAAMYLSLSLVYLWWLFLADNGYCERSVPTLA